MTAGAGSCTLFHASPNVGTAGSGRHGRSLRGVAVRERDAHEPVVDDRAGRVAPDEVVLEPEDGLPGVPGAVSTTR